MTDLIGICGKKRAGKNTLASLLVELRPYQQLALADGVWDVLLAADPIIDQCVGWRLSQVVAFSGKEAAKQEFPEVRSLLQRLGTDGVRKVIGESTWIDVADKKVKAYLSQGVPVIVTDLRFPNEAEWVRSSGGTVIKIERSGEFVDTTGGDGHESESFIEQLDADFTVYNNGDLNKLRETAYALLSDINKPR